MMASAVDIELASVVATATDATQASLVSALPALFTSAMQLTVSARATAAPTAHFNPSCQLKGLDQAAATTATTASQEELTERLWLQRLREYLNSAENILHTDFDLLRWLRAYEGDVEVSGKKLRRHERIRHILQLDDVDEWIAEEMGVDEAADEYAPMTMLGEVDEENGDHRILLLEQSGRFDLGQMMKEIRMSAFMVSVMGLFGLLGLVE